MTPRSRRLSRFDEKVGFQRRAVRPVRVEQERRPAVERHAFPRHNRHRHFRAVARDRPDPARLVRRRIVPAEHLLLFAERARARVQVVVVHRRRGDHRFVGEPHRRGVELGIAGEGEGVVRLVRRNPVRAARLHVDDAQERQPALSFRDHEMAGKERQAVDLHRRVVIDEGLPAALRRIGDGRRHDAEVLRRLVGEDVEQTVVVVDFVLVAGLAREHDLERAGRIARVEVADFA